MSDIADKVAYVKAGTPTGDHTCHWTGCKVQVPPSMWGCSQHWYKLPRPIRNRIWAAYRPGQEIRKDPSESYLRAAAVAQAWIDANHA